MSMSYPILYSFRRCPYAMRARLAIAVSEQVCELREVVLRDKPRALLQASPKATVPVLVDEQGQVIDQSLEIMLWALQRHDPQRWLMPTLHGLPAMLALIAQCDEGFKHNLDRYKYPDRYENVDAREHRDQAGLWLMQLEARLADLPFLFGPQAALADMAIAPFVRQFAHTDRDWFDHQPWPALQRWLQAWQQSALFERVMFKFPPWAPESPAVLFPN
jgi:glutathione S-transferase